MAAPRTDARREADLLRLVGAHQAGLWRYLRFLGATATDAEDLVQETFLEVWRRPFEQRSAGESASYLRTVARHRYLMHLRRRRARPEPASLDEAEGAWVLATAGGGEDRRREALRACLEELPARSRQALDLQLRDGWSREQIAETLALAVEGVKTLLRRAREALHDCVQARLRP